MESLGSLFRILGVMLEVVIIFNIVIIVHEVGHFLAARWRGLKVDKFQIWFGKPIWKKTVNGVQYGLGSIPAGGFVALPQMAPMEAIEGKREDGTPLEPISPLDKIIVAVAGPLFSLGLAFVFATLVWGVGKPVNTIAASTTIGYVQKDSPAEKGGLKMGDEILKIDGEPIKSFHGMVDSVKWTIISSTDETIPFEVRREGGVLQIPVTIPKSEDERTFLQKIYKRPAFRTAGISPGYEFKIESMLEKSPGELAGLKKGDVMSVAGGQKIYSLPQYGEILNENKGQEIELEVLRDGAPVQLKLTPQIPLQPEGLKKATDGVIYELAGQGKLSHPSPFLQVKDGLRTMIGTISAVFSPKSEISAAHLSGPIGIMRLYYLLFESPEGWRLVLWFSVILNLNLAILNMLPFPVLDGGHVVMATIEGVMRRPINLKVLEVVQLGCVLLLFGFMIFVSIKDTGDIFGTEDEKKREPISFLPAGSAPAK